MPYLLESGIQVSLGKTILGAITTDPTQMVWYRFTDHNRDPIDISIELIETQSRMANGTMRKYVVDKKNKISVSWKYVPSKTSECVDGNHGAAWIESLYRSNASIPVYLKIISSRLDSDPSIGSAPSSNFSTSKTIYSAFDTGSTVYNVFMTNFSKKIINRTKNSDYVDMSIEFTEI